MYKTMKDLVDDVYQHIDLNRTFLIKLNKYRTSIIYKDNGPGEGDNSEFLGSNLMGVKKFVMGGMDIENFYKYILLSSEETMKEVYHQLDNLNNNFIVASNPMNLALVTIMHLAYKDPKLSKKDKYEFITEAYNILSYKMISSIVTYMFNYKPDPSIATAVYEAMNNKYILKRCGTWQDVINYKSSDVLPGGIFEKKLIRFTVDDATYVIAGIYGRYKDIIKNMYDVLVRITKQNERITSSSKITTVEDSSGFGETVNTHNKYITFLKGIINNENDLINSDLIHVVHNLLPNCRKDMLSNVLVGLANLDYPTEKEYDYLEKIMVASFTYLGTRHIYDRYDKRLLECLKYLKGYWTAGNIKDPLGREVKVLANKIVNNLVGITGKNMAPILAIGLLIYIFLRAIYSVKS